MIPSELPRPLNDDDFERMCADVYAEVFQSRCPQQFGGVAQQTVGHHARCLGSASRLDLPAATGRRRPRANHGIYFLRTDSYFDGFLYDYDSR